MKQPVVYSTWLLLLLTLWLFTGCEQENNGAQPEPAPVKLSITDFTFPGLKYANVDISERIGVPSLINVYVPSGTDLRNLTPLIVHNGVSIEPAGDEAQDFSRTVVYTLTAENGDVKEYNVQVAFGNSTKQIVKCGVDSMGVTAEPGTNRTLNLVVPYGTDIKRLSLNVEIKGLRMVPDLAKPNDYSQPLTCSVVATDGSSVNYTIKVKVTRLPVLVIKTPGGQAIESREDWITGATYKLYDGERRLQQGAVRSGNTDIKGRGNTSWNLFEKKPYSMRLEKGLKDSFLGMPAHRRWTLINNAPDKTLLRNSLALKIGQVLDNLQWTPRAEQVSLYLNGEYRGLYLLVEQIKTGDKRVDIPQISVSKPDGGYVMELTNGLPDAFHFATEHGKNVNMKDPNDEDDLNDELLGKIKANVQRAENAIYAAENGVFTYPNLFNVPSIIDFILANEVVKNRDVDWGSVYFYYHPKEQKFYFGPLWDFDIAFGNATPNEAAYTPDKYIARPCVIWLKHLFNDAAFTAQLQARWQAKSAGIRALLTWLDTEAAYINEEQQRNFTRWDVMETLVWPNLSIQGGYSEELKYVRDFFSKRLDWIDVNINKINDTSLHCGCNH
ncbi:MAG: CotH kinase family protein [Dysgonamonadaceae bacterium]|jgi:hypothetical protein|nr:CotH kinase family protein [Dysgonamonadaceae bacterium]